MILTYKQWKEFTKAVLEGKQTNEELFTLCLDYYPHEGSDPKDLGEKLYERLKTSYILDISLEKQDVQSFIDQLFLKARISKELPSIPDRSKEIPAWMKADAAKKAKEDIGRAGVQREDIYGSNYLKEFFPEFTLRT